MKRIIVICLLGICGTELFAMPQLVEIIRLDNMLNEKVIVECELNEILDFTKYSMADFTFYGNGTKQKVGISRSVDKTEFELKSLNNIILFEYSRTNLIEEIDPVEKINQLFKSLVVKMEDGTVVLDLNDLDGNSVEYEKFSVVEYQIKIIISDKLSE